MIRSWCLLSFACCFHHANAVAAFVVPQGKTPCLRRGKGRRKGRQLRPMREKQQQRIATMLWLSTSTIGYYAHDGYEKLSYRYTAAADASEAAASAFPRRAQQEQRSPILLIHPVGIGMSAWYWDRLTQAAVSESEKGHPAMYAVNLLGCGMHDGSDAWNPDEHGIHFPLGWVTACETLIQQVILPVSQTGQCHVVVQGGLAPVGVLLADRNPDVITKLVLTSPPSWRDMVSAVPEKELQRNYAFLRSSIIGKAALSLIESRWAVKLFSDLFLFANESDELWLDNVLEEACKAARPPVQAFNAGFCNHRSYLTELSRLAQPVLILQGRYDVRTTKAARQGYVENMPLSRLETLADVDSKTILPWEAPTASWWAMQKFLYDGFN